MHEQETQLYILNEIKNTLQTIADKYKLKDNEISINRNNATGVISINVKDKQLYHFFDEQDLVYCVLGKTPHEINKNRREVPDQVLN